MANISGNIVSIDPGESYDLNVPIVELHFATNCNISIDGRSLNFPNGFTEIFPSIYGYPGGTVKNNGNSKAIFIIRKIGDVLNKNYFTDWRT